MTTMRTTLPPQSTTVADFLDWRGDGTAKRYQLIDGEIRPMAPASAAHGLIHATIASLISNRLTAARSPCVAAIMPAVVPRVRADVNLRIPDIGVTCKPIERGQIVLPDPVLLVEILWSGDEVDTWKNVWAYTTIPSVQEILVVHSTRVAAELLRRQTDFSWPENPKELGAENTLRLQSVDLICALSDLYAGTHLA